MLEALAPTLARTDLLRQAEKLVPALASRAQQAEHQRRIPDETVADIRQAGLIRIANPEAFGGWGLDYDTVLEVVGILGRGCGSTSWCYSVWASHNWIVGMYPMQAQEDYFSSSPDVLSSSSFGPAGHNLEPADGGFRLAGRWSFSSGADAADWAMIAANHPEQGPGLCLVPRSDYRIDDNWFVSGLKGTGSKDLVIETPTLLPAHRFLSYAKMVAAETPGRRIHNRPTYRVSMYTVLSYTLVWPLIGMADGALRDFEQRLSSRTTITGQSLADSASVQMLLAESAIDVESAYSLARQDLAFLIDRGRREEPLSDLEIARTRAHQAYVARLAVRATNRLFEMSGGHGLFDSVAIQRFHRDVNAGSQQTALTWHINAEEYARRRLAQA
jgi:alkylation response protein AidB-like acyl-CoA dehydrogenase